MDLGAYRRSAESFLTELTAEFYRHYAGLQDEFEIEPIYGRHSSLFTRSAVEELRGLAAGAGEESEARRRLTLLLDFAVEGYLGEATKDVEAELARREAAMSITVDGRELGFRESAVVQANEADKEQRELIERARLDALAAKLQPLQRELIERQHAGAAELGWRSYREMCEQCKSLDLAALHAQTERFLELSEERYVPLVEPELQRTVGVGFE